MSEHPRPKLSLPVAHWIRESVEMPRVSEQTKSRVLSAARQAQAETLHRNRVHSLIACSIATAILTLVTLHYTRSWNQNSASSFPIAEKQAAVKPGAPQSASRTSASLRTSSSTQSAEKPGDDPAALPSLKQPN